MRKEGIERLAGALAAGAMFLLAAGLVFGQDRPAELRIGLMPAYNSIPIVVADAAGLFRVSGVEVRLVPFSGQLERETALQAGALDGTVSDLINAILAWRHGSGAQVTSVTEGNFCLLAAPAANLSSLRDWPKATAAKVRTGLLEASIVYYLTERMLLGAGADLSRLELVPIVQLPVRLEMLIAGKVDAACLPEPLAALAVSRGARPLADSDGMGTTPGVLLFTKKALAEKRDEIAAFYRAYDAAVDEVNVRPLRYRNAIAAGCAFPPAVADLVHPPRFRHRFLPPQPLVADVARWMAEKGLLDRAPAYAEVVAGEFAGDARAE